MKKAGGEHRREEERSPVLFTICNTSDLFILSEPGLQANESL